jgi:hypothetical protein
MKIMATCLKCGRDFQLDQLIEGPVITGRCPWCQEVLAPDYTVLLPEVIRRAEAGGSELVSALKMMGGSWARFRIKPESVLGPIREELGLTEEQTRERRRLRDALSKSFAWVDESTPEEVHEGWSAMDDTVEGIERDLREAATSAETMDARAAQEVESVSDELAASAEGAGASSSNLRGEVAYLRKAGGGRVEVRDRFVQAAHDLSEARKAERSATLSDERAKAALEQLRHALREAEEALVELGA